MGKAVDFREVRISELKPYERNAKKHSLEQVKKLGRSIQEMGFISPCLIDQEHNVIAGHGRIMAAKEIGLEKVPCVFVEGLTEEQRRAYILADNRLAEFSDWDMDTVSEELQELAAGNFDIGLLYFDIEIPDMKDIDFSGAEDSEDETNEETPENGKNKPWKTRGVKCDMKPCISARVKDGHRYVSLHASSKEGLSLEEIKNSRECERQITEELTEYIQESLGTNIQKTGWSMVTTGRRRHREGYHFATEVCKATAEKLGIRFYEGAITCGNADRLKPALELVKRPEEKNLILFDDIITTGTTMTRTVELLQENGYTVLTVIGIRNQ